MPELLLEIFSEELPARMQADAALDLERMVVQALTHRGYAKLASKAFATPRRLALVIDHLDTRQPDVVEERKGPRVNAPEAALQGFLKSTGLTKDQLKVQADPKGDFYLAEIERKGLATRDVLAAIVGEVMRAFPWPKSMRVGAVDYVWVRPIHTILCLFDGHIVPFAYGGIDSGDRTAGHRFLGAEQFSVRNFADYREKLRAAHVILDAAERAATIKRDAMAAAAAHGLTVIEDEKLLDEVAGLVEWPVVLTGTFDRAFLDVPPEVLTTTMRTNQKYFALKDAAGHLSNRFVIVANMVTRDGGKAVIAGNERVLRARLSDAKFFWDNDLKTRLEDRLPALKDIVFHARLGTQYQRVERIEGLAGEIATAIGASESQARRAARLAKADLVTGTVGEFPEVQGAAGRYLARAHGEAAEVADAIRDHYLPKGQDDAVPSAPVSMAVALADKLDMLVGFFAIDEKPTGSKDPFALRRAGLGIINIVLAHKVRLPLARFLARGGPDLAAFLADRLKAALKDKGTRHDLIDAVFALPGQDDLVLIVRRVEALQSFLKTPDGENLHAGYKRAANILKAERKKEKYDAAFTHAADPNLLRLSEERALASALATAAGESARAVKAEDFAAAMTALASLRPAVDAFFEKVTVNDPDPALRANRLALLNRLPAALLPVADFTKIEG